MSIKILFFSLLTEVVGKSECDFRLPEGEYTIKSILEQIYIEWPDLKSWDSRMLIALDLNYVGRGTEVVDGQTLALMPPLQGG
ncbi:MAG: hypothetical protein CMO46_02870 [Verrucomicrobiales bacterium]|nr:hypothetical protein [Verrucomicrobiales bacterium]